MLILIDRIFLLENIQQQEYKRLFVPSRRANNIEQNLLKWRDEKFPLKIIKAHRIKGNVQEITVLHISHLCNLVPDITIYCLNLYSGVIRKHADWLVECHLASPSIFLHGSKENGSLWNNLMIWGENTYFKLNFFKQLKIIFKY